MQEICMKYALISAVLAGLVLCALCAGCTSPTQAVMKPGAVSTPAPADTLSPATPSTAIATPVQVQTLPAEQYVDIQLSKERPDNTLHLLYNGGKGEINVQNILMRVTLSTGEVIEQYMNDNQRHPRRGDELIIRGTSGSDRVEVYVTSVGQTYKIIDKPMVVNRL
jgi:hypothetical protein